MPRLAAALALLLALAACGSHRYDAPACRGEPFDLNPPEASR